MTLAMKLNNLHMIVNMFMKKYLLEEVITRERLKHETMVNDAKSSRQ